MVYILTVTTNNMTTKLNLKNLRKGDNITLVDLIRDDGKHVPALYGGIPLVVRAISLPFVYVKPTAEKPNGVVDTRQYTIMRISKNAV